MAIWIAAIPAMAQLFISTLVFLSLWFNHRANTGLPQIIWRAGNRWLIETTSQSSGAELVSVDFLSRQLVILTLKTEMAHRRKFVIFPDSLPTDTFRLLRVRLRIEAYTLLNPDDQQNYR